MRPRRAWVRTAFRWSWLVTLPFVVLFAHWALRTGRQFAQFGLRVDTTPFATTLRDTGQLEFDHLRRELALELTGTAPTDADGSNLPNVEIFLGAEQLASLDENLPYSGETAQEGRLRFRGTTYEVGLRYRGDTVVHWGYFKKSFRINAKKGTLVEGMRKFNLIVAKTPEQLNNYLSYRLASRLGLITPTCELVRVFLNGHYHGLYELTEQLEEGTLRRHDRMPGDLYAGELIMLDRVAGTSNRVFELPRLWSKVAANNHYDLASMAPLERLHAILQGNPDEAGFAALDHLLDIDRFARLSAFELLTQTHHNDHAHNWRLFWDPWRLRFEPVVWDPVGWHASMQPVDGGGIDLDPVHSQLHEWLHMHAGFLRARHRHLEAFFDSGKHRAFLDEMAAELRRAHNALRADPNALPQDDDAIESAMVGFYSFADRVFGELAASYVNGPEQLRWSPGDQPGTLDLEVTTRRPMDGVEVSFDRPQLASMVQLQTLVDGRVTTVDLTHVSALTTGGVRVPAQLISALSREFVYRGNNADVRNSHRRVEPTSFRIVLGGVDTAAVREVRAMRGTESPPFARAERLEQRPVDLLFRVAAPRRTQAVTLAGEVPVRGVVEVLDPVVIRPGTTFRLAAGASLLFRNRVIAEGTRNEPVRFVPATNDQDPWGTVAINGPDCADSTFRWCEVRGGSGYKVPLEEYCSMFSIHNCTGVRVEDCKFAENHQYDDMIHVMYGEVTFDRVTLSGARADALDCDISTVTIRNSAFPRSGNDGVDLMTTHALVLDCTFEANGDKGISIGEGSSLIALRNRFMGCNKAMEAKDGSVAHVANCEIRSCRKALNAYKKNWRYGSGGYITVHKSVVVDNQSLPTADTWSSAELVDCQVKGELVAEYDQEYVDGTSTRMRNTARLVDHDGGPGPKHREPLPFPEQLPQLRALAGEAWKSVRADVRGVPGDR